MALRSFFLLLRAQVLPGLPAWDLWRRLLLQEKIYLRGHCQQVTDDPDPYLLLNLDILAAPLSPWRGLEKSHDSDSTQCDAYRRFHDRVEQREVDEYDFILAAALWLCRACLPLKFLDRSHPCWA